MKRIFPACVVTAGMILAMNCGGGRNVESELDSIIRSELDFAGTSTEKGIKAAFLAYLDSESIVFRPHPMNGISATESSKETTASLQWAPSFADIAASGEMGYTTGPWEFRPGGIDDTTIFYGSFISVWKKQTDDGWKVVLDIGVSNPPPQVTFDQVTTARGNADGDYDAGDVDVNRARLDLLVLDQECSRFADVKGTVGFYDEYAADSMRLFRDGITPIQGKPTALSYYSSKPGLLSWAPFDAIVSEAADLGYTYGSTKFAPEGTDNSDTEYGYYVRIWRRSDSGEWKIVLDVISPSPPPEEDQD